MAEYLWGGPTNGFEEFWFTRDREVYGRQNPWRYREEPVYAASWTRIGTDMRTVVTKGTQGRDFLVGLTLDGRVLLHQWDAVSMQVGALPDARVGESYYQQLHAIGGANPHFFFVRSGLIPPGLELSNTTSGVYAALMGSQQLAFHRPLLFTIELRQH